MIAQNALTLIATVIATTIVNTVVMVTLARRWPELEMWWSDLGEWLMGWRSSDISPTTTNDLRDKLDTIANKLF